MEKDLYWFNGIEPEVNSDSIKNSYLLNTNDKNIGCKVASDIANYIIHKNKIDQHDELVFCSLDKVNNKVTFDEPYYFQNMPQIYKIQEYSDYVIDYPGDEMDKLDRVLSEWKNDLIYKKNIDGTIKVFNKLVVIENSLTNLSAMNKMFFDLLKILQLGPENNVRIILINMEDESKNFNLSESVNLLFFHEINLKLTHDKDRQMVKINGNLSDKPIYYFNPYIHN